MKHFDLLFEIAADNNGLITSSQARAAGIARSELARWCRIGRLERLGHGVYLVSWHVPVALDPYAQAVALCGSTARLFGESVIALHELAPTDPSRIYVAVGRRTSRCLPANVRTVPIPKGEDAVTYEGIVSQSVFDALLSCGETMLPERVTKAAVSARNRGLISDSELNAVLERVDAYGPTKQQVKP